MVKTGTIQIPGYDESASRVEFCCVRCLYAIPVLIVGGIAMIIFAIIIYILSFINFFAVVLFGKRMESLYDLTVRIYEWQAKVGLYLNGLTDERPPLVP